SWDCLACTRPWPCDPAREELATELGRTSLAMYLFAYLNEAAGVMPGVTPGELYERFLAWTRTPGSGKSVGLPG
ncbi:flavin reductase, partial [Actinoplanes bogorensis]